MTWNYASLNDRIIVSLLGGWEVSGVNRTLRAATRRPRRRRIAARAKLVTRPATAQEASQAAQGAALLKLWKREDG